MRIALLSVLLALAPLAACKSSSNDADNTSRNDRDKRAAPNADHGAQGGTDLTLTQDVRKAIVGDGSLSTNAHNCKIVVDKGAVTLVGPVASAAERARVVSLATGVAGVTNVIDQLEVTN